MLLPILKRQSQCGSVSVGDTASVLWFTIVFVISSHFLCASWCAFRSFPVQRRRDCSSFVACSASRIRKGWLMIITLGPSPWQMWWWNIEWQDLAVSRHERFLHEVKDVSAEQVLERSHFWQIRPQRRHAAVCAAALRGGVKSHLFFCDDSDGQGGRMEWGKVGGVVPRLVHVDLNQCGVVRRAQELPAPELSIFLNCNLSGKCKLGGCRFPVGSRMDYRDKSPTTKISFWRHFTTTSTYRALSNGTQSTLQSSQCVTSPSMEIILHGRWLFSCARRPREIRI